MGRFFECDELCNTKLVLALGSIVNPVPKSIEKDRPLDLNLALGNSSSEHSGNNNGSNDDECEMNNGGNKGGSRKKLRLSKEQSSVLEESFNQHSTLNTEQKNSLATQLNLLPRQVEVWFQNRRARTKLKLTETDCERWKKGYEEIAEENKKLKKELDHFHAMKRAKLDCPCGYVCPNCRRGWTGSESARPDDDRVVVLKPKAKQGGVKIRG